MDVHGSAASMQADRADVSGGSGGGDDSGIGAALSGLDFSSLSRQRMQPTAKEREGSDR